MKLRTHKKLRIFISHAQSDLILAKDWKLRLNFIFGEQVEVDFVADGENPIGGSIGFIEAIIARIKQADLILMLLTPWSENRPWIVWEAGVAVGFQKSQRSRKVRPEIVFLKYGAQDHPDRAPFNHPMGHPLHAFNYFDVADSPRLLQAINLIKIYGRLSCGNGVPEIAVKDHHRFLESPEIRPAWEGVFQRFDRWIRIRLTPQETEFLLSKKQIPTTAKVDGTLNFVGLSAKIVSWQVFQDLIIARSAAPNLDGVPNTEIGQRWVDSLTRLMLEPLTGDFSSKKAEGLPLILIDGIDDFPPTSYRPSLVERETHSGFTRFRINFTTIPNHLNAHPRGDVGVLTHLIEFTRTVRWGVLENAEFTHFDEMGPAAKLAATENIIRKLMDLRADFYGRGLSLGQMLSAFPEAERAELKTKLLEYFELMQRLKPENDPEPATVEKLMPDLRKYNKLFYLAAMKALLPHIEGLSEK